MEANKLTTTPNNGWTIPNDTDLVRDGAQAIRTLAGGIDTTIGDWNAYTPTISTDGGSTNWALGNGNILGRYQKVADIIHFEFKFAVGSTTTKGNGGIQFSLPLAANSYVEPNWYTGIFYDSSGTDFYPVICRVSGSLVKPFIVGTTLSQITSTSPVTIATSDYIVVNGSYPV
jgi:hypothetical protein